MISIAQAEDAVASANAFLERERGTALDGDFAARTLGERVLSVQESAEALLTGVAFPNRDGWYLPLSKHNAGHFDEAVSVLPGHIVLVPPALVHDNVNAFYPAVVSEDGAKSGNLRLHVLKQPYHQTLNYGAHIMLSGAGQSETPGIGDHGRQSSDGVEAEHFATLLTAASDAGIRAAWQAGQHVNHEWRGQQDSSVTTKFSEKLFGQDVPQTTITITREQIAENKAMLLWHEGLRDENGRPDTAAQEQALVIVQSLGHQALRTQDPGSLDAVKELLG